MNRKNIRKTIGIIAIFIATLLMWVRQTVRSMQLSYDIRRMETSIAQEQKNKDRLEIERDKILSLQSMENYAKQANLITPTEDNIIVMGAPR